MQEIIKIAEIPTTVDAFTTFRNKIAVTPAGGAAAFIVAMLTCVKDHDLGIQFFTLTLDKSQFIKEVTRGPHVKGFAPDANFMFYVGQLDKQPWIASTYIQGTSHDKGYLLPALPYSVSTLTNDRSVIEEDKLIKIFVECTGADSARPLTMEKNDKGIWKVHEVSSLFVGTKSPADNSSDDL